MSTFKVNIKNSLTKGKGVFAQTNFVPDALVISSKVEKIVPQRNRYTLERNGHHIIMDEPALFINHSCDPNCQLVPNEHGAYDFLALKSIQNEDEITFDYEIIENEIVGFTFYSCGSSNCRGILIKAKLKSYPDLKNNQSSRKI